MVNEENFEEELDVQARSALLEYYSSELISHASIILTIAILIATIFWGYFQTKDVVFSIHGLSLTLASVCATFLSILFVLLAWQILRFIYWARLTTSIIKVQRVGKQDERRKRNGLMRPLHEDTSDYVKKEYLRDIPVGWLIKNFLINPRFNRWSWGWIFLWLLLRVIMLAIIGT